MQQYYEANWAIVQVEVVIPFTTQMDLKSFLDVSVGKGWWQQHVEWIAGRQTFHRMPLGFR